MNRLKRILVNKIFKFEVYCKIVKQRELLQYREAPGKTFSMGCVTGKTRRSGLSGRGWHGCPSFRHVHRTQISGREKERESGVREVQRGREELSRGSCSLLIQHQSAIANTCYHGYPGFNQALVSRRILWPLSPLLFAHDWRDTAGRLWDTLVKIGHRLSTICPCILSNGTPFK